MTNEETSYMFAASKNGEISRRWVYNSQDPLAVDEHRRISLLERSCGHSVRETPIGETAYLVLRDISPDVDGTEERTAVAAN